MPLGSGLELVVKIVGDSTALGQALGGASKSLTKFGQDIKEADTRIGKIAEIGKKAADVTIDMAKAGKDAALAEQEFANELANLGAAQEGWQQKTDDAILSAQKLGQTDDAARDAITTLVGATGDLDTALGMLPGVMDVAAKGNTDMAAAADAVAKAYGGNDLALKRMVDDYSELEEGQTRIDKAFATNATAAENWASSTEGTSARVNIAMSEVSENIGGTFATAFSKVKEALQPLLDAMKPFLEAVRELLNTILPFLNPLIESMGKFLGRVANALSRVVSFATRVLDFFTKLLEKLSEVGEKISGLLPDFDKVKNFGNKVGDILPFGRTSAATGTAGVTRAGAGGSTMGAPVFNIYGDPAVIQAKVASAIRDYNRRNGIGAIIRPGRT